MSNENNNNARWALVTATIGIVGVLAGTFFSNYLADRSAIAQRRVQALVESTHTDEGHYPPGFIDIKQFVYQLKTLSGMDRDAIESTAKVTREYPKCPYHPFQNSCMPYFIKIINISRVSLGNQKIPDADIDIILRPFYERAVKAAGTFGGLN